MLLFPRSTSHDRTPGEALTLIAILAAVLLYYLYLKKRNGKR